MGVGSIGLLESLLIHIRPYRYQVKPKIGKSISIFKASPFLTGYTGLTRFFLPARMAERKKAFAGAEAQIQGCKYAKSRVFTFSINFIMIDLLRITGANLPDDLLDFVGKVNNASIVTRYPEDLSKLISAYPEPVAREYLNSTCEVVKRLKQDARLKKL